MNLAFYIGVAVGMISRMIMLNTDQNQYPTYPNVVISQLILAFVASALGALLVPALVARSYTSITFLSLAAEQFRQVRANRRNTLQNLEQNQLVKRGEALIEEIARAFEVRNYMCIITSFITVGMNRLITVETGINDTVSLIISTVAGLSLAFALKKMLTRNSIADIADVVHVPISFKDESILCVGDVKGITNIGLKKDREVFINKGIGIEIIPKDKDYTNSGIIYDLGQRQAIAYNLYSRLGRYGDSDDPAFTPLLRRNPKKESIVLAYIPVYGGLDEVIQAIKSCPVIETAKGKNLSLKDYKIGTLDKEVN